MMVAVIKFTTVICVLYLQVVFMIAENTLELTKATTVEEIHHAVCNISTKEVQATANVTISKQLKGICTSNEIQKGLKELEIKVLTELELIKGLVRAIGVYYTSVPNKAESNAKLKNLNSKEQYDLNNIENSHEAIEANIFTTTSERYFNSKTISYQRNAEAIRDNNTIQETELGKSHLYFWKIFDINDIVSYYDTYIESPILYFRGQHLQIKLYPHHLESQYIVLELSSDMPIMFKHRFIVLNQKSINGDLTSQILGVKATMFKIANKKLSTGEFTMDGSLIVKLVFSFKFVIWKRYVSTVEPQLSKPMLTKSSLDNRKLG